MTICRAATGVRLVAPLVFGFALAGCMGLPGAELAAPSAVAPLSQGAATIRAKAAAANAREIGFPSVFKTYGPQDEAADEATVRAELSAARAAQAAEGEDAATLAARAAELQKLKQQHEAAAESAIAKESESLD